MRKEVFEEPVNPLTYCSGHDLISIHGFYSSTLRHVPDEGTTVFICSLIRLLPRKVSRYHVTGILFTFL
jgi:hypothetical protein